MDPIDANSILEELDIDEEKNYQDSRVGWNSFQVGYA